MLTNRTLSAEDASEWGLVTEVVADAELADRATTRRPNGGHRKAIQRRE